MTPDDDRLLLSVYIADARAAYGLFEVMPTEELRRLAIAHELDLAQASAPESLAFGGGRLALIRAVLKARGVTST